MHSRPGRWPNLSGRTCGSCRLLGQLGFVRCFHAAWARCSLVRAAGSGRGSVPRGGTHAVRWRGALEGSSRGAINDLPAARRGVSPVWVSRRLGAGAWRAWSLLPGPLFVEGVAGSAPCTGTAPWAGRSGALYVAGVRAGRRSRLVAALLGFGASRAAGWSCRRTSDVSVILLSSCLCWTNCTAIDDWETWSRGPRSTDCCRGGTVGADRGRRSWKDHRPTSRGCGNRGAPAAVASPPSCTGDIRRRPCGSWRTWSQLTPTGFLPVAGLFG